MITPMIRPMITSMVTSIVSAIRRTFIDLDPALSSFYSLSEPHTFTGDFEIEFDISTTTTSDFIMGGFTDANNKWAVFLNASGFLQYSSKIAGVSTDKIGTNAINDGKYNSGRIVRVDTALIISVNGLEDVFTVPSDDFTVTKIGVQDAANYFKGIIANVKLTDLSTVEGELWSAGEQTLATSAETANQFSTVTLGKTYVLSGIPSGVRVNFGPQWLDVVNGDKVEATGSAIRFRNFTASNPVTFTPSVTEVSNNLEFRLDEPVNNYELPVNNVFGSELNTDGSIFSVLAGLSTINGKNVSVLTDSGGAYTAVEAISGSDTSSYLLSFTADVTAGQLDVTNASESSTLLNVSLSGSYSVTIPSGGLHFKRALGGVLNDINMTNISIRQVTNAITYENIPTSNREQYTKSGIDWLGSELIVNGGFDTDTDWTKGTGWSISGGNASSDGAQVADSFLFQAVSGGLGLKYELSYSVLSIDSGIVKSALANNQFGDNRTAAGSYSDILTFTDAGFQAFIIADSDFIGSIDNASLKRLLEGVN